MDAVQGFPAKWADSFWMICDFLQIKPIFGTLVCFYIMVNIILYLFLPSFARFLEKMYPKKTVLHYIRKDEYSILQLCA